MSLIHILNYIYYILRIIYITFILIIQKKVYDELILFELVFTNALMYNIYTIRFQNHFHQTLF